MTALMGFVQKLFMWFIGIYIVKVFITELRRSMGWYGPKKKEEEKGEENV